jgi:hypothetical protein
LAAPRKPELTNWAGAVFFPPLASREEACGLGYESAQGESGDLGYGVIETLIGPIAVQSVYGSTYNTCRVSAQNLVAQPTGLPLLSAIVYVYNSNFTNDDYYEAYQVAFVILDEAGNELARLTPTSQELGQRPRPNDPFRWIYFFDPNTFSAATIRALEAADRFQLLVNRNNGVEVYDLTRETFPNFK